MSVISPKRIIMNTVFKTCPMCAQSWADLNSFLNDKTIVLNGFQPNFSCEGRGHFYFTHNVKQCGSSMLIQVENFLPLYNGTRFSQDLQFTAECPELCLEPQRLERCQSKCKNAFVREIAQIIMNRTDTAPQKPEGRR